MKLLFGICFVVSAEVMELSPVKLIKLEETPKHIYLKPIDNEDDKNFHRYYLDSLKMYTDRHNNTTCYGITQSWGIHALLSVPGMHVTCYQR